MAERTKIPKWFGVHEKRSVNVPVTTLYKL